MAAITNWITADEVRSLAVKRTSFDTAIIEPNIPLAQRIHIYKFLGKDFYNEINAEIIASNLSEDNTALLVYLKKALAYFVLWESFFEMESKQTTKGMMQDLSEFGQKPSGKDLEIRRQDLLDKANKWLDLSQEYINEAQEDDSSKFPNYSAGISDTAQKSTVTVFIP